MQSQQLPAINQGSMHIEAFMAEEYYGIRVTFSWESGELPQEQAASLQARVREEFNEAMNAREARWQKRRRAGWRSFPPVERSDFAQGELLSLLDTLRGSAEWNAFYADPARSTVYGQLDGAGESYGEVEIPQFREDALQSVWVSTEGGEIVFQTRDA